MTRLPWQHTRSRTKSGSDRSHLSNPQDWFSRSTLEPSRQALAELVKAHKRERSDESIGSRTRSRGTTITSNERSKNRSRAGSRSDDAWATPDTPQRAREGSVHSSLERTEGSTKAFLAKGSMMLKRSGSKMSLSSTGSSSTLGFTGPPWSQSSHTSSIDTTSRDEFRPKISAPFDFQYITHAEQTQFAGLNRIDESDLAQKFSAIQTGQLAARELGGIKTSHIVSDRSKHDDESTQPTSTKLPTMSPLPPLPPKDDDVFGSSRPLPRDPYKPVDHASGPPRFPYLNTLPPVDTSFHGAEMLSSISCPVEVEVGSDEIDLDGKPLPLLPVIHAVTTEDDTARAMITTPLPTPPGGPSPAIESDKTTWRFPHQRQKSSIALPRHALLYPSTKLSMPDLSSTHYLAVSPRPLPRYRSDMALSDHAERTNVAVRASASFGAIDTLNWEDAVDEAWDDATDADETDSAAQSISFDSYFSGGTCLPPAVSVETDKLATSTTLTMAPTRRLPPTPADRVSPAVTGMEVHKLESVQEDEPPSSLAGLGISQCPVAGPIGIATSLSRSSSLYLPRRQTSLSRSVQDTSTRSSSQESIIFSIASSIIGTQRSSSSSVFTEDMISLSHTTEQKSCEAFESAQHDQNVLDGSPQKARPESGCLPIDKFEQTSSSYHTTGSAAAPTQEAVSSVALMPSHSHSKSAPKIPERRSSTIAPHPNRSTRMRSNTTGTRPRQNARISYSLFPTSQPLTNMPTATT